MSRDDALLTGPRRVVESRQRNLLAKSKICRSVDLKAKVLSTRSEGIETRERCAKTGHDNTKENYILIFRCISSISG